MSMSRMPPTDFGRVQVDPGRAGMPVGDPTLWGGTVTTILPSTVGITKSTQIVGAQAVDRYARSWSLSGVLALPQPAWNGAGPDNPPQYPDPTGAGPDTPLEVWLSVIQGIDQIVVEHLILLMAGGPAVHNYGLCNQQSTSRGGPYGFTSTSDLPEKGLTGYPFACIGALIGNTISARAIYNRGNGGLIPQAQISLLLTPYAPGAGI